VQHELESKIKRVREEKIPDGTPEIHEMFLQSIKLIVERAG
jgi:hypothetical protein